LNDWFEVLLVLVVLFMVWVELGREVMDCIDMVRSEGGGAIVDAMDMVRDWFGMLPELAALWFGGGGPAVKEGWDCEATGAPGNMSDSPDSRRRLGITLPLIVWLCSGSLVYEVMDIVRSSGRSGTTRP
jgi:hypothetical protein